ncbi:MAG: hypothetical protein VW122_13995, partial [Paracoccaceae bacterium]
HIGISGVKSDRGTFAKSNSSIAKHLALLDKFNGYFSSNRRSERIITSVCGYSKFPRSSAAEDVKDG